MEMAVYKFGTGVLYGVSSAANATPTAFGALQDVTLDFSFTNKELYGQYQYPLDAGRGEAKLTGKAKLAQVEAGVYNDLFAGATMTTGTTLTVNNEAAAVPAATPFTVDVANSATFVDDLGVRYAATGVALEKVASTPSTGQYSESSGTYTFSTADGSAAVLISYTYTVTSGQTISADNQLQGVAPYFSAAFNTTKNGKQFGLKLFRCMSEKLAIATKLGDYNIDEFDFVAMADASNRVYEFYLPE